MYVMLMRMLVLMHDFCKLLSNTSSCFSCFRLNLKNTSLAMYVQYREVMTVSNPAFAGWKNGNLH